MRYDLHCHSIHSDGEKTVEELLNMAKKINLSGLSITDHDTIEAYHEAYPLAEERSLGLVNGVELSCLFEDKPVHVLAYSFSIHDPDFKSFIAKCQKQRAQRNHEMIRLLNEEQIAISQQEIEKAFNRSMHELGRPHFAQMLIEKGIVKTIQEAFNRYLADGKRCFVLGHRPSVQEAIDVVHRAKAFAILAHPHLISDLSLIGELLKLNLDGMECYYAKMGPHKEKPWVELAQKKRWMITGGSDYHGMCKPINTLGCSWVSDEVFDVLKKRNIENDRLFLHQ